MDEAIVAPKRFAEAMPRRDWITPQESPVGRTPLGLRERKKQRTRAAIASAALNLFLDRGFDEVTVAEVARAADVSEATVFSYFRTKEDLVYNRLDEFWTRLVDAVEHRSAGDGIVDAVERFLLDQPPIAQTSDREEWLAAINRMIAASPGLLTRERASYDQAAIKLAGVIARTTPLDDDATAAAQMILGVHKALIADTREQLLAGMSGEELARRVTARIRSGYALLRHGLDS
jgi:AcrR family transcriptional regulator